MKRFLTILALMALVFAVLAPAVAFAQAETGTTETPAATDFNAFGRGLLGIGAGLVTIGGGLGIGRIGSVALESMARQPEVAGQLQANMLIAAALVEGLAFFALIICFLIVPGA